ncbi:hypothetical protein BDY19DRAFT_1054495 [Irpex rosettiformis]|uniref:Uncharacterized protein n=1 Tax=Irpex rosettiformis TaxID=378272 RepID=A0ACB8UCB0_9APHY|nr:hypothetical protein BDY19DRAFT_1054495 [Irpex rosettiformis]
MLKAKEGSHVAAAIRGGDVGKPGSQTTVTDDYSGLRMKSENIVIIRGNPPSGCQRKQHYVQSALAKQRTQKSRSGTGVGVHVCVRKPIYDSTVTVPMTTADLSTASSDSEFVESKTLSCFRDHCCDEILDMGNGISCGGGEQKRMYAELGRLDWEFDTQKKFSSSAMVTLVCGSEPDSLDKCPPPNGGLAASKEIRQDLNPHLPSTKIFEAAIDELKKLESPLADMTKDQLLGLGISANRPRQEAPEEGTSVRFGVG